MQALLTFVAECVDLTKPADLFEYGAEFMLAQRKIALGRTIQWPMVGYKDLFFSIPEAMLATVTQSLVAAKSGTLSLSCIRSWTSDWEVLLGSPDPAVYLTHRQLDWCIMVASWPKLAHRVSALQTPLLECQSGHQMEYSCALCPQYKCARCAGVGSGLRWYCIECGEDVCGNCVPGPELPKNDGTRGRSVSFQSWGAGRFRVGDRVEVNYEQQWYVGTVHCLVGPKCGVRCDGDKEGVVTFANIDSIRAPAFQKCEGVVSHRRIKSFG